MSLVDAVIAEAPEKEVASPYLLEAERSVEAVKVRPVRDRTTIKESVAAGGHPLAYPAQHQISYAGAEHLVAGQQALGGGRRLSAHAGEPLGTSPACQKP